MAAVTSSGFDGILAAMIPAWQSEQFASMFVRQNPAWQHFLERGRIQAGGFGTVITCPTSFPTTTGPQVQRIGANVLQELSLQLMTGATAATFKPALYAFAWAVSRYQLGQLGSDTEKANWAQFQTKQAMERQFQFIQDDWWVEASTANSGGMADTQVGSLQTYINSGTTTATDGGAKPSALASQQIAPFVVTTGTTAVTSVGNIERASAGGAYWACPLLSPSSSAAWTIQELSKLYNLACGSQSSNNEEEPDIIIMPSDLESVLQNLSTFGGTSGGQIVSSPDEARIGHNRLYYKNARIVFDDNCPTAGFLSNTSTARVMNVFCLNSNYLGWRLKEKKPKAEQIPVLMPVYAYMSLWMLQFIMWGAGRHHSRHCNVTAP